MFAILSDIHANLEALNAVQDDIRKRSVTKIYCLGDTVGYGPDPESVAALVQNFDVVLRGNFDDLVLNDDPKTLVQLRRLAEWARNELSAVSLEYIRNCSTQHVDHQHMYAHGSPLNNDYLFPEHIYDERHMRNVFDSFNGTFFCGHSHIAGVHTATEYISPDTIDYRYKLNGSDVVVNVGSVGQPRDQDTRACYVLLDDKVVHFIRLDYDIETTRRKLNDGGFGPTYWDI